MKNSTSFLGLSSLFSRVPTRRARAVVEPLRRQWGYRRNYFMHELRFDAIEKRLLMTDADDSISEAFMLGALSTTSKSVSASISPDTDVNMVGFDIVAGQVIDFDIDTPLNGPGGLGTKKWAGRG